jgi:hypothetical protein
MNSNSRSSSNTKPGAAFRHSCRSRHSVHPERPVFKPPGFIIQLEDTKPVSSS